MGRAKVEHCRAEKIFDFTPLDEEQQENLFGSLQTLIPHGGVN